MVKNACKLQYLEHFILNKTYSFKKNKIIYHIDFHPKYITST